MLLKSKPSIISNNLAEKVANEELKKTENFQTLRSYYTKLMNQLQIDGIPVEKISTIGQKIIVEKKRLIRKNAGATYDELQKINIGRDWFEVARELNFTDPKYSHKLGAEPQREIVPLSEYEKENSEYIKIINDTIKFLKEIALQKLKTNHFMSLLNEQDDKITIALHDWRAQLEIAESFFDHKEKIPVNTQHILLHALGTMSSNNDAAEEYFNLREKAHNLTGKQLSKYRSGLIKTSLAIFNPKNRITAILWKYFGSQCMKCNSWKVMELSQTPTITRVICLECDNKFEVDSTSRCNFCGFPFFDDEIALIKKGNICPNCKEELPEYLINHIVS